LAQKIVGVETSPGQIIGENHEALPDDMPSQKAIRWVKRGIDVLVFGALSSSLKSLDTAPAPAFE
jgi:hypothetical protein